MAKVRQDHCQLRERHRHFFSCKWMGVGQRCLGHWRRALVKHNRNVVGFQTGEQLECLVTCRVEILVIRPQLDPLATEIAYAPVVLFIPVWVERMKRHERDDLVGRVLCGLGCHIVLIHLLRPTLGTQHQLTRTPWPRGDSENKRLIDRAHVPQVIVDRIGEVNRLTRAHCRLGDHLIGRYGTHVAWKVGVYVNNHFGKSSGSPRY